MIVTHLTDSVKFAGLDELGRAKNEQSYPCPINNFSASSPDMLG